MRTPTEHRLAIETYYKESQTAYYNWGQVLDKKGIYGVHLGLDEVADHSDHHQAVARLTDEVISRAQLIDGNMVLDAGCGSGAISLEIGRRYRSIKVVGINISWEQLMTANQFVKESGSKNVYFLLQDYLQMGFDDRVFDRIIFCESMTHSNNKKQLLAETRRVLKPGGRIVIFDAFDIRDNLNGSLGEEYFRNLREGWAIPSIPRISDLGKWMIELGFMGITTTDYSRRVLSSVILMGNNSEMRLKEGSGASDVIQKSRLACIATRELMLRQAMGYFCVEAELEAES